MGKLLIKNTSFDSNSLKTKVRLSQPDEIIDHLPITDFDNLLGGASANWNGSQVVIENPQNKGFDTYKDQNGKEYLTKDGQFVYYMQKKTDSELNKHFTHLLKNNSIPENCTEFNDVNFNSFNPGIINIANWCDEKHKPVACFQWIDKIKDPIHQAWDYDVHGEKYRVRYEWFKLGKVVATKLDDKIITQIRFYQRQATPEKLERLLQSLANTTVLNSEQQRGINNQSSVEADNQITLS